MKFTEEELMRARSVDLLTYLQQCEPGNLARKGNEYHTVQHDSLKISGGKWHWHSRGIGGKGALDYLMKVKDESFVAAMQTLLAFSGGRAPVRRDPAPQAAQPEKRAFLLPEKKPTHRRVFAYLQSRGVDPEIINYAIKHDLLYEDQAHSNAVFVGLDDAGAPAYAFKRSTLSVSTFASEAGGSNKKYCFKLPFPGDTMFLFESAIDLLSYASLIKMQKQDWRQNTYLALGGVQKLTNDRLPPAVEHVLTSRPNLARAVICFDNDRAGYEAGFAIQTLLENRSVKTVLYLPKNGKDWSEYLMLLRNLPVNVKTRGSKETERTR
jgi:hypothetical protein